MITLASNSKVIVTFDGKPIRTQHLRSTYLREVNVDILSNRSKVEVSGWFTRLLWKIINKKNITLENHFDIHVDEKKW